jgi:hypothetical protein
MQFFIFQSINKHTPISESSREDGARGVKKDQKGLLAPDGHVDVELCLKIIFVVIMFLKIKNFLT